MAIALDGSEMGRVRANVGMPQDARTLYDTQYVPLVAQLHAMCGDRAEAEDAVQEAFVRALLKPDAFAALDNPVGWLRTVAVNQIRGRWRRRKRHRAVEHLLVDDAKPAPGLSPHYVAIVAALQQIPFAQREAIVMHHIADMSVGQIADALGVPAGTVKARLSRGRAALANLLQDEEDHHA
ncbi:RNA polymerase sigma factor [Solicola gregarius]|uniref:Sigma-70 family RNA polymerase sigma factor n=1 Tax=Solicola gregarius TaxID=2908642 RepID=A0AA46YJE4_9ACTN|nr:sigma-70 family RNA polymerase sigma factor [Solicola gregarius]UYM03479.1 sigma-70 family RNA polymerase sigma factor [Solicola gregarius]